jgi:hypothetical protein
MLGAVRASSVSFHSAEPLQREARLTFFPERTRDEASIVLRLASVAGD